MLSAFIVAAVATGAVGQRLVPALKHASHFRLANVVVSGTCLVDRNELAAYFNPMLGRSIFSPNLRLMARILETHPMIKRSTVRRLLPRTVAIEVQEREPLALIVLDERLHGVDEEGILLPPFEPSLQPNLPLLTGWEPVRPQQIGRPLNAPAVSAAIDLLKEVAASDPLMAFEISEVRVDTPGNLTFYTVQHGIRVVVGAGHFTEKIAGLRAVLSELGDTLSAVHYIDLRFDGQVVVGQRPARPLLEHG